MSDEETAAVMKADAEIARSVRAAAEAFNAAVDKAHAAGLSVDFANAMWPGAPVKMHVTDVHVERPADWDQDFAGWKL